MKRLKRWVRWTFYGLLAVLGLGLGVGVVLGRTSLGRNAVIGRGAEPDPRGNQR